jgi:hypothetical protein
MYEVDDRVRLVVSPEALCDILAQAFAQELSVPYMAAFLAQWQTQHAPPARSAHGQEKGGH